MKNPASLDPILDDAIQSNDEMPLGERPSDEWLPSLDALTASLSPSSNTTTENASYLCAVPLDSSNDPTQNHTEQLAKLVIAIGRSVSALSSPARRPSLSASSPPFSSICASASSLIMIMIEVSQPDTREHVRDMSMLELDSHLNPIPAFNYIPSHPPTDKPDDPAVPLSPGTLMMTLACY